MKAFVYNDTEIQRDELILYVYSAEIRECSVKELKITRNSLLLYFPKVQTAERIKPAYVGEVYFNQWEKTLSHLDSLIEEKISRSRSCWGIGLAIATVVVLILTLADTFYHRAPIDTAQPPKYKIAK